MFRKFNHNVRLLTDYTLQRYLKKEGKLVYQLNIYSRNLVLNLFFGIICLIRKVFYFTN